MLVKESIINPEKYFNLNGLEYEKGEYTLFYNNYTLDSTGTLIKDEIHVGIRSQYESTRVLVHPVPIDTYTNGVINYTSFDDLILFLSDLIRLDLTSMDGVAISQKATNFSSLSNGEVDGDLAYVEESQGTKWNPLSTYKPAGWYVWNGTEWVSDRNAIATQLENNIISLNTKVDKSFLGWVQYTDTEYTEASPLIIPANTRTKLTNNVGSVLNVVNMFGAATLWNPITNKFENDNSGDTFNKRIQFIADPTLNNRNLTLELDIGGAQGVIWARTIRLARGGGVDTKVTENIPFYTLNTFINNGGELYLTCDGDLAIYDIVFLIERTFRNN